MIGRLIIAFAGLAGAYAALIANRAEADLPMRPPLAASVAVAYADRGNDAALDRAAGLSAVLAAAGSTRAALHDVPTIQLASIGPVPPFAVPLAGPAVVQRAIGRFAPPHRAAHGRQRRRIAPLTAASAAPAPLVEPPSLFGRLFSPAPSGEPGTAVYSIAARMLTMPDGTRLEVHSGLGECRDNVACEAQRMRGPTHLGTYSLRDRGEFHGARAVGLDPLPGTNTEGRAGFLLHPYLMGGDGSSNGCVSVKDFDQFRRAYDAGQVRKLKVEG